MKDQRAVAWSAPLTLAPGAATVRTINTMASPTISAPAIHSVVVPLRIGRLCYGLNLTATFPMQSFCRATVRSGCRKPESPALFRYFENLVAPYPDAAPPPLPRGFFAFLWACARGMRRYIAAMTLFTALIGVFEALLFSILGRVVDWLAKVRPSQLWA